MLDIDKSTVDILAIDDRARGRVRKQRLGTAALGVLLTGVAFSGGRSRRSSVTRLLFATAGGLLVARGVSGLSVRELGAYAKKLFTFRSDLEKRFYDGEHDIVDAASFDSFPASDPPSYSPGAT